MRFTIGTLLSKIETEEKNKESKETWYEWGSPAWEHLDVETIITYTGIRLTISDSFIKNLYTNEKKGRKTWHEIMKNTRIRRIKSEKNLVFFSLLSKHRTFVFHIEWNSIEKSLFVQIHIERMNFLPNDALHSAIRFDSWFVSRFAQR